VKTPAAILKQHGLRPKKAWGQNFLADPDVLSRIARLCGMHPGDRCVELGAGLGHLTRFLAASGGEVYAIERDRDLIKVLQREFEGWKSVHVRAADATSVDFTEFVIAGRRVTVAGNLPYNVSTPILFHLLEQRRFIERAVVMLQQEVAERLAAEPGGKEYGVLSVVYQLWADVDIAFTVGKGAFYPAPDVDSAVVLLRFRPQPRAAVADGARFRRLVQAAFNQRRKTLGNALKGKGIAGLPSGPQMMRALERAAIDPQRRGETLSVEEFARLERELPSPS
jgi:16S rRNA (adenine1518-N6/adenine1519-N6)-dimethyltransferase